MAHKRANKLAAARDYAPKIMCGQFIDWQHMLKTIWEGDVNELFKLIKTDLSYLLSYEKTIEYWNLFRGDKANFRQRYNFLRIIMFLVWYQETFSRRSDGAGVF